MVQHLCLLSKVKDETGEGSMARIVKKQHIKELYQAILELKDVEECENFFRDLCSPVEISSIEQRYAVAKLLTQNTVYLKILEETKASTATISRVNRVLNDGTGVLRETITKLNEKENHTSK